jgi:hypothetical protein
MRREEEGSFWTCPASAVQTRAPTGRIKEEDTVEKRQRLGEEARRKAASAEGAESFSEVSRRVLRSAPPR